MNCKIDRIKKGFITLIDPPDQGPESSEENKKNKQKQKHNKNNQNPNKKHKQKKHQKKRFLALYIILGWPPDRDSTSSVRFILTRLSYATKSYQTMLHK